MAREIITEADVEDFISAQDSGGTVAAGGRAKPPKADEYSDRLIKFIPTEIVALFLFVNGLVISAPDKIPKNVLQWVIFGIMLILTYFYQRYGLKIKKWQQLLIGVVSFAIWVFTLGGPFTQLGWYDPFYGAVLTPIYTFGIAIYKPEKK